MFYKIKKIAYLYLSDEMRVKKRAWVLT